MNIESARDTTLNPPELFAGGVDTNFEHENGGTTMEGLQLHCTACDTLLTGTTEEELLATVQEHVGSHGHFRPLTIEHIRSRLEREPNDARGDHPR